MTIEDELSALNFPLTPIPLRVATLSGLYVHQQQVINVPIPTPVPNFPPIPDPGPINPGPFNPGPIRPVSPLAPGAAAAAGLNMPIRIGYGGELRLDVDGLYPQQVASGTLRSGFSAATTWVAHVTSSGANTWTGSIFYKDGSTSILPYTAVTITVTKPNFFLPPTSATVVFSGGGGSGLTLDFAYQSPYFHQVEMEYDSVSGTSGVTSFDTGSHPNRPATLPSETLTIETIYRRAGFDVRKSGGDSAVPLSGSGSDSQWSITEMNDAMSTYWSKFASHAQWSLWTLFAALSDQGSSLGGIMFDYSGTIERQGCAIFENAFISQPPNGEAHPTEWVRRMRFWTACHEVGHTFNLAHSWQESLTQGGNGPWIPLTDEPEGRTFMNYPYNVNGGTSAFFSDFAYRFSDQELLFMRHAPERFVEQGNADWFDHHGFRNALQSVESQLALELRVHRSSRTYTFLEPVYVELKLQNVSNQPVLVDEHTLLDQDSMAIIIKRQGDRARQRIPYARFCMERVMKVLHPGEALYESVLASVGKGGWDIAEPGRYQIQVALRLPSGEDLVSNVLTLRVEPPKDRAEQTLADDLFEDEVGRALSFGGTRVMTKAIDTLEEVSARLGREPVARHARLALGRPLASPFKVLEIDGTAPRRMAASAAGARVTVLPADVKVADAHFEGALDDADAAAETLGHIRYRRAVERYSTVLEEQGALREAEATLTKAHATLSRRGVLSSVLNELASKKEAVATKAKSKKK